MTGNRDAFHKAMNLGHSAAWDQLWDRAAGFYRNALEEFPDHPGALSNLGLALFELKDYDNALRVYTRAAVTSPQDPVVFEKIGKISERMGKLPDAVKAYSQSADLYLRSRDVEKSIDNWVQVLRLQESLAARTRLAMIYDRLGRKNEAVTEYLAAASLMQHSGNLDKARQAAEYALQLMPDSSDARQTLVMLRKNQPLPRPNRPPGGTGPTRITEVRQLETSGENNASLDPIGEARQESLAQLAALLFDQAEDSGPENSPANHDINSLARGTGGASLAQADRTRILLHLSQAIDAQTKDQDTQAVEELERAMEVGLKHPAAYFNLGLLKHQKDPQKALRLLQEAVKNPHFALASYLLIAKIQQAANNLPEASVAYLQALCLADSETLLGDEADGLRQLYEPVIEAQSREKRPEVLKTLCDSIQNQLVRPDWCVYLRLARQQMPPQPEGSPPLPLAEMLLESKSGQVVEMLAHIRSLAAQNKITSAMEEAYHALQYAPTYLPLHIQIGDLLLKEGHAQDAVDKFLLVAELYTLRGESTQAIQLFDRVIGFSPMNLAVRSRLIELLLAQGKTELAVQQYIKLADVYYQLAELDNARQSYTAALRVAQPSRGTRAVVMQILYKIADIDMQRIDWRNAMRVFEQIRTLEPEDIHGRARLVDIHYRMGQEPAALNEVDGFLSVMENSGKRAQAIDFLKEVLTEQPEAANIYKRLAEVYQHDGKNSEAIAQWKSMSDLLVNQGDRPGAIAALQSVLALNPHDALDTQRRIQQIQRGAKN